MKVVETDVCIVGSGIVGVAFAKRFKEKKPDLSISILEAGRSVSEFENRFRYRQRMLDYGEDPWFEDKVDGQKPSEDSNRMKQTMTVGGSTMHWSGFATRFSPVDLRLKSTYNVAVDWPLDWEDLERYYCQAERFMGVSGEAGPFSEDRRSESFPMPPIPLSYNLSEIQKWAKGVSVRAWSAPVAKNSLEYDGRPKCLRCDTCIICPTGAKYSPDFTLKRLSESKSVTLFDQMLARKLILSSNSSNVVAIKAQSLREGFEELEFRAKWFVIAAGYYWTPYLLLLSANDRFPTGLANRYGLVGRYMSRHDSVLGQIRVPIRLFPGMNAAHSLYTSQFMSPRLSRSYIRHDLKILEDSSGAVPRPQVRTGDGKILLGSALLEDWKKNSSVSSTILLRAIYDSHFDFESTIQLSSTERNRWGDPLPKIRLKMDASSQARKAKIHEYFVKFFEGLAKKGRGELDWIKGIQMSDHLGGGCIMGLSSKSGVCDSYGRTFEHENLILCGGSILPTLGATNPTLTFVALALRSAEHLSQSVSPS